jgi:hypothetical protein
VRKGGRESVRGSTPDPLVFLWYAFSLLWLIVGAIALFTGYALTAQNPRPAAEAGSGPAAVYLRSFADDRKNPLLVPDRSWPAFSGRRRQRGHGNSPSRSITSTTCNCPLPAAPTGNT